jgi:two-component system, OmpR family, response regulator
VKIVIVEEDAAQLAFVARGLRADGYAVTVARDGESGLERALAAGIDLVVLGLLLPGLDGLSVLRALRERRPELPVIVASARADLETKLLAFELGADDYLVKPFPLDELRVRIAARLRRRVSGPERLEAGELVLDPRRRQAHIGTATQTLSERELDVLRYLVEHDGEIVSRERLLSAVWGYTFDPHSNIVDVYIGRLRRKLRRPGLIETVRHAGYRLAAA